MGVRHLYHVGGNVYELVRDNKNGWNLEVFRNRYSEVLDRYDYVVGDWGYSQLRLRGFFKEGNPRSTKDSIITGFEDYINEYCNFGCAYFILEKIGQTDRPDDRDPLVEEAELAEAAERAAGRIGEDGILRVPAPEKPARHDRYNRGGVEVRGGRAVRPDKNTERASGGGERAAADGRPERNSDREHSSSDRERSGGRQERRGGEQRDRGAQASVSSQRGNSAAGGSGGGERADRSDRRHKERRSGADASRPDRKGDGNRRPRRPGSGGGSGSSGGGEAAQQQQQGHKDRQQHAQQQQHPQRKNTPSGDSSSN